MLSSVDLHGSLSSPCLHTLILESALPRLDLTKLPALKHLRLKSLYFTDIYELGDGTNASSMKALSDLALHLASSSVVVMGDEDGYFTFHKVPQGLLTPMLQALLPLKHSFRDVTRLRLKASEKVDAVSLALLSCLFENLGS